MAVSEDPWTTTAQDEARVLTGDHARLEHTHAVAGLFQSVQKDKNRPQREVLLDIDRGGRAETWRFVEPWALDAADQTVLLAIVSMMAQRQIDLSPEKATRSLALTGEAQQAGSIYIETSVYEIVRKCGWAWSQRRKGLLLASLDRLSHVTLDVIRDGTIVSGGTLLARVATRDGGIAVTISPWLASVLVDPNKGLWARIDLGERRHLSSDKARLLHAWLCAWLRPGAADKVGVDRLIGKVWTDDDDGVPDGTLRRRRYDIRVALREIGNLPGWHVSTESARGVVTIHRAQDPHQRRARHRGIDVLSRTG